MPTQEQTAQQRVINALEQGMSTRRKIREFAKLGDNATHGVLVGLALEERVTLTNGAWKIIKPAK